MIKNRIRGLLCAIVLLSVQGQALAARDIFSGSADAYLVKVGNRTLWDESQDVRLPPASLTKMMTALLALERVEMSKRVTISRAAAAETGSKIGVRIGETYSVHSMLAAALIRSGNDACHALADAVSGSEQRFVALMNSRAKEMGLRNTQFTNACGHDDPAHYSSAHDLAILGERLLNHKIAADLVSKKNFTIRALDGKKRSITFKNSNHLLGEYPGMLGGKTGYTPGAGKCLVAVAKRGNSRALIVLLNAPNRWQTATQMLNKALDQRTTTAMR